MPSSSLLFEDADSNGKTPEACTSTTATASITSSKNDPCQTLKFNLNIKTDNLSDIVFVVGETEEKIVSHKILLALSNDVFKRMFVAPGLYKNDKVLKIPEEDPAIFKELLLFVLLGTVNITEENMIGMHQIAERFEVDDLLKISYQFIMDNTNENTLFDILIFNQKLKDEGINQKCFGIILNDPLFYFSSDKYDSVSDLILNLVIQQIDVKLTERQLFIIAMKWSHLNSTTSQEPLESLRMNFKEFVMQSKMSENSSKKLAIKRSFNEIGLPKEDYNIVYVMGKVITSGIFKPQDISIVGFEAKKTVKLVRVNYYIGSQTHSGETHYMWIVVCEHLQEPTESNTYCKILFKKKIKVTYTNYLKNENYSFDNIVFEESKTYGIQFLFQLPKELKQSRDNKKIMRYHLAPCNEITLNNDDYLHIIPNCNYTNNVIINSIYLTE